MPHVRTLYGNMYQKHLRTAVKGQASWVFISPVHFKFLCALVAYIGTCLGSPLPSSGYKTWKHKFKCNSRDGWWSSVMVVHNLTLCNYQIEAASTTSILCAFAVYYNHVLISIDRTSKMVGGHEYASMPTVRWKQHSKGWWLCGCRSMCCMNMNWISYNLKNCLLSECELNPPRFLLFEYELNVP